MKTSSSLLSQSSSYLQNKWLTLMSFGWEYFYAKGEKWREETSLFNIWCVFKKVYSNMYRKLLYYQQQTVDHKGKHISVLFCDVLQDVLKCFSCIVAKSFPLHKSSRYEGTRYSLLPYTALIFCFALDQ